MAGYQKVSRNYIYRHARAISFSLPILSFIARKGDTFAFSREEMVERYDPSRKCGLDDTAGMNYGQVGIVFV